jgi:protocatechuate 3,4-dioxygenase beta subunit
VTGQRPRPGRHLSSSSPIDRRQALGLLGAAGAALALGCGADSGASGDGGTDGLLPDGGASGPDGGTAACVLDPSLTRGPYWIDERLNRSDIRSDTTGAASPNPRPGVPLVLTIETLAYDSAGCTALAGAQVDLWHCDGWGIYSGVAGAGASNTTGQNFLRGYQVTDATGRVTFTTIYPGWYSGRAVHIHVKVRLFDAGSNTTTEATTQLFFDDALTDTVFASATPYSSRGARDTRNVNDGIYGGHSELLVAASGSVSAGYTGSIVLGVRVGLISAG